MKLLAALLVLLFAAPALADAESAMKELYRTALSVEKRAAALTRPAKPDSAAVERMDAQLQDLKKELTSGLQALPPAPPTLAAQHATLRDMVTREVDWLSKRQHWIATGSKGNPAGAEREMNQVFADYARNRDALKKDLR